MVIDNFSKEEFEAVLPLVDGKPIWKCLGIDRITHQYTYSVTPFADSKFSILVYSSIKESGVSSSSAGKDSLRAVITRNGKPYGGKSVRFIDRRTGWQRRLFINLRRLANQIRWLALRCPGCGCELVPLTAGISKDSKCKPENKGRAFVACCSMACRNKLFEWTEEIPKSDDDEPVLIAPKLSPIRKDMVIPRTTPTGKELMLAIGKALGLLREGDINGAEGVLRGVYVGVSDGHV